MNRNFAEILSELCGAQVEFLLVGGWAVALHGYPRATADFDIWVHATADNAVRVMAALTAFGAPMDQVVSDDFARPGVVFQMGLPPQRIDLITELEGVTFQDAWSRRVVVQLAGLEVPVIGLDDLITNKRATARPRDLTDAAELEAIRAATKPAAKA